MRDFIFISILLSMAGLGIYHFQAEAWTELSIDLFVAWFALRTWNPRKNFRR
jgi:hypothetical protein